MPSCARQLWVTRRMLRCILVMATSSVRESKRPGIPTVRGALIEPYSLRATALVAGGNRSMAVTSSVSASHSSGGLSEVEAWVERVSRTTQPDQIVWCDGSDTENQQLIDQMLSD